MQRYLFIDFIRFWGMFSIVYIHSIQASDAAFEMKKNLLDYGYLYDYLLIPLKFGSVCFFMISGFLLGDKLMHSPRLSFLKKRFNNTMIPYLVSMVFFIFWNSLRYTFGAKSHIGLPVYFSNLLVDLKHTLLYSPYWFIWNFFIAVSVVVIFRKYIFTAIFPVALLAITILYSANVYLNLFTPIHTSAIFAFIFYLWAGVFIHKNKNAVSAFIKKTPLILLLFFTTVFLLASIYETEILYARNSVDANNTLKFSNQLFSIGMFFVLMKISDIGVPRFFNPNKEAFGIYLYHMFFVVLFARLVHYTPLNNFAEKKGVIAPLTLFACYFLFNYLGTTVFVKVINKTSFSWLVGNKKTNKPELLSLKLKSIAIEEA